MPVRTCIGCRRAFDKRALVRLAAVDGALVVDPGNGVPGRGAYICPERPCLDKAHSARNAFSRAFRTNVATPGPEAIWLEIVKAREKGS
ncbi:MAG: YlxR family protein [Thermodesulfobacteriota bacterium]